MKKPQVRHASFLALAAILCWSGVAAATGPEDAKGLWMTAEKDAVIEFADCPDKAGALCGHVVWDKDASTATDTCGLRITQTDHYEKDAWRDGWVYDPRTKKNYKAAIRAKDRTLNIRAFIGVEALGETEQLVKVASLPSAPVCKKK